MNKYAIIIAGPSGAGKTTIADNLILSLGNLEMSRSATTREKRGDGRDDEYIYLQKDEFLQSISNGDMLEYTNYGGNYYGTRKSEFERIWNMNKNPILVLDYYGVKSLKSNLDIPVFAIYAYTKLKEARTRLIARDLISAPSEKQKETLIKRVKANVDDYKKLSEFTDLFDLYVENDSLDNCLDKIKKSLRALMNGDSVMSEAEKKSITEGFKKEAETFELE
ncbi:MAG: hypothetical protein E7673_00965 [Ruminococcaceae bacterium]|nr:hypothetical protein [Oscillospiraceae bacterium]